MFHGSMVALVTPMQASGAVDYKALSSLVDFHVEHETDAIISVGTTGESATLNVDEHLEVIKKTCQFAAGRVPVIAGTGANATDEAIVLTDTAMKIGVEAALLVTPYYNKPTQEGLYQHFKAIADAVPLPQILYNVPGRTAVDMLPETVAKLSHVPNIVGIKDATGDLSRIQSLLELCSGRLDIFSGDDETAMEAMLLGAKGDISVVANVAPALMHEMCKAAIRKDRPTAEAVNEKLSALHTVLFCESNPIPVKWAMAEMGLIGDHIRLPLTQLSPECHPGVRSAMQQAGINL